MALFTGRAYYASKEQKIPADEICTKSGYKLLEKQDEVVDGLEILAEGFENSKRKVVLIKVRQAYAAYVEMIRYYALGEILQALQDQSEPVSFLNQLTTIAKREQWMNVGGQLMPSSTFLILLDRIRSAKIKSWDGVHAYYLDAATEYDEQVLHHAMACLMEVEGIKKRSLTEDTFEQLLDQHVQMTEKVYEGIVASREKDMSNPFRKMVFDDEEEQLAVIGKLSDNTFIKQKEVEKKELNRAVEKIKKKLRAVLH